MRGTAYLRATAERPACRLLAWDPGRPYAGLFQTGYEAFTAPCGIDGLARIDGEHLHVLAVVSAGPGAFRRFVQLAKLEFAAITVWEVWNPIARDALLRYDFEPTRGRDADGKPTTGLTWSRQRQAEINQARDRAPGARWHEAPVGNSEFQRRRYR